MAIIVAKSLFLDVTKDTKIYPLKDIQTEKAPTENQLIAINYSSDSN